MYLIIKSNKKFIIEDKEIKCMDGSDFITYKQNENTLVIESPAAKKGVNIDNYNIEVIDGVINITGAEIKGITINGSALDIKSPSNSESNLFDIKRVNKYQFEEQELKSISVFNKAFLNIDCLYVFNKSRVNIVANDSTEVIVSGAIFKDSIEHLSLNTNNTALLKVESIKSSEVNMNSHNYSSIQAFTLDAKQINAKAFHDSEVYIDQQSTSFTEYDFKTTHNGKISGFDAA